VATRSAAALVALCLMGQAGWAEPAPEPRWIPSIDFGFDTFAYSAQASVENDINPPEQEGTQTDPTVLLPFRLGGELMGPAFEGLPGRPRLFVQGGLQLKTFSSDKIFKIGELGGDAETDVTGFRSIHSVRVAARCDVREALDCWIGEPGQFEGQGSEIYAELQNPSWYAALGVAFSVPIADSLLFQVKPSIAYNVEEIDMTGRIATVVEIDPVNEMFEIHRDAASASSTDHSIGVGIELALGLFRDHRPIRTSLFVDARFLWLISDSTTEFSSSSPISFGSFTVERDEFGVRGGAGVRFSWMGFGER
jgi:hypothetical protein